MNPIVQRIGALLALLGILASYGGHWGVLQTMAWSGMVLRYSRDAGLVQGIQDTFDGEHPCSLCTKITEARGQTLPDAEWGVTATHPPVRHFAPVAEVLRPPATDSPLMLLIETSALASLRDRPPTPPPRACA